MFTLSRGKVSEKETNSAGGFVRGDHEGTTHGVGVKGLWGDLAEECERSANLRRCSRRASFSLDIWKVRHDFMRHRSPASNGYVSPFAKRSVTSNEEFSIAVKACGSAVAR